MTTKLINVETNTPEELTVGGSSSEGVAESVSLSDHTHGLPPFGSGSGEFTEGNDPRLSDDRDPTAHAPSHEVGGSDEIDVTGLSGELADPQLAYGLRQAAGLYYTADTSLGIPGAGCALIVLGTPVFGAVPCAYAPVVLDSDPRLLPTVYPSTNDFRLTGVSNTPVMTSDSTSLSTIYLTPCVGNQIALYSGSGSTWKLLSSSQVSLAITGRTADLPFDIFAYDSSGTVTLEFLDWTNATTRATALIRQNGVWCKTGALTRRYLGTCRPRSSTAFHWVQSASDAPVQLDLWNVDNRKVVPWTLLTGTNTWTYTTATWRQSQGSANYQVEIVAGLEEEMINGTIMVTSTNSINNVTREVGFGVDSTSSPINGVRPGFPINSSAGSTVCTALLNSRVEVGSHYYSWLEISTATGTTTWYGDNGTTRSQSGMTGFWTC